MNLIKAYRSICPVGFFHHLELLFCTNLNLTPTKFIYGIDIHTALWYNILKVGNIRLLYQYKGDPSSMDKVYPFIVAIIKRIFRSLHLTISCRLASYLVLGGASFALNILLEDQELIQKILNVTGVTGQLAAIVIFVVCFSLFDEDSKHKYLVKLKASDGERSLKYDLDFILHFRFRYTDYIALLTFMPLAGVHPLVAIIAVMIYFAASLLAMSLWVNELHSHDYESYNENKLISLKGVVTVLVYLIDITLIFYVVPLLMTYIITFARLFKNYAHIFLLIIAALVAVLLIRGYTKRSRFIRELKTVCKNNDADIKIYPAAKSLFLSGRRALTLEKNDKRYDIYFIPTLFRSNIVRIYDGFKFNKVLRLAVRNKNKFTITIPLTFKKKLRLKGENTDIVVFSPSPKTAQVKERGIREAGELHDADKIWGVGVFSGEGFRNAFDRACRDKQKL